MSFSSEFARARAIAWKDLTAERRTKANFNAVLFFTALILLLFGFALGPDAEALRQAAAGVLWLTVLFGGVLSFNRSYEMELEGGALEALLLYPGDRRALFVGKVLANLAFLVLIEIILVPVAAILYDLPLLQGGGFLGVMLLGTIGFVTLGTFYAAMASRVRAREVLLLPLLLFPMLVPLLLSAVEATKALLVGNLMGDASSWVRLLLIFDVIFVVATFFAFEYVIEE